MNNSEWISVEDRLPQPSKEDEDNSDNVLVWCDDKLMVMAYCYIDADEAGSGWCWCNCYGDINGDPEFDDEYKPTHWMPLPQPPTKEK